MSARTSLRTPKGRIALLVVLFLFSLSIAPLRVRNAYAQESDLVNDIGSDADVVADESTDDPIDAAKPKPVIPNLAGTWNGSIISSLSGAGTLQFVISQTKRSLRGNSTQSYHAGTIVGNFSGAIAANNSIKLTLISSNVRGCVERASAQLISKFEFNGSFSGNKKCGFDHGSFDVISSLAPTPTPTVTPTATPTSTPTATQTATPTATMTPLEFESVEVIPLPPLTVDPPQPASLTPTTVTVKFPGATNIALTVSGDGCGSLTSQTVSSSQLTETQPVGQFGLCSLVAQIQTPSGPQTLQNGFTVEPTNVQLPALKVVDGFFVPGALPSPSGNTQEPDIGSIGVPPTVVNGGTAQVQITLADPTKAPNVTSVLIQVQGAGGYNGYFSVPATLNGSTIIANLALDPAFGVASPSATPTATPAGSVAPWRHQKTPLAKGMIAGSRLAPASGGQLQIIIQLVDALGNVGNQMMQALNTALAGTGSFQVSLSWDTPVDLDLHVVEPSSEEIYYGNPVSSDGGTLDLDSNAACNIDGINNENVSFPNANQPPPPGQYTVRADFYEACGGQGANYTVTTRVCGNVSTYTGSFVPGDADFGAAGSGRTITTFTYPANCQYRVRGTARYEDFAQSATGFAATSTMLPIRYAHVVAEGILDGSVFGSGETDQNGQYDLMLQIPPNADSEYVVTVKSSANIPKLTQTVQSQAGAVYSFSSDPVDWAMNPDETGLDINVTQGSGAAAFNIFDQGVSGAMLIRRNYGVSPSPLTWTWTSGAQSTSCGGAINCFHPDTDIIDVNSTHTNPGDYNDLVLLHEYGHFWQKYFSRTNDNGGTHSFTTQALPPLAYSEGSATFFGCTAKGTSLYLSNGPTDTYPTGVRIQEDINSLDASIPLGTDNGNPQTGKHSECLDSSLLWHMSGGISTASVFKAAKRLNTSMMTDRDPKSDLVDLLDSWFCLGLGNKDLVKGYTDLIQFPYDFQQGAGCGP